MPRLGLGLRVGSGSLLELDTVTVSVQEANETAAAVLVETFSLAGAATEASETCAGVLTEFSPSDIAGLSIWFEADSGVALSGSEVTSWTDRQSSFAAAQGTSAKRPTYSASDAAFNNKPSLAGTLAAATQLTNTTDTPFAAGATRTMFFAFKLNNTPATNVGYQIMDSRHAATARPEWIFGDLGGQAWTYTDGVAINQTIPPPASFTTKHYLSEIWTSGAVSQVWLDGVSQTVSGGNPSLDVSAAGFDIFSAQNAARPFDGKIVAILGYTGALSTPNRQAVEAYIAAKWF